MRGRGSLVFSLACALCAGAARPARALGNIGTGPLLGAAPNIPAFAPFLGANADDSRLGMLADLGQLSGRVPGFEGMELMAPYLDRESTLFNPGLAGPLLQRLPLDEQGDEPSIWPTLRGLAQRARAQEKVSLTAQEKAAVSKLMAARRDAGEETARLFDQTTAAQLAGQEEVLRHFLLALVGSGLYPNPEVRANGNYALNRALAAIGVLRIGLGAEEAPSATIAKAAELHGAAGLRRAVSELKQEESIEIVVGDPAMERVMREVRLVASDDRVKVLIRGESGTGKGLVARAIHALSPRAAGPFGAVNAAAISGELLESEIFGHAKGAFTGARKEKKGLLETLNGGALFLDEIGDLPWRLQVKLLHYLQTGEFHRLGEDPGAPMHRSDVRLLIATNQPLEGMLADSEPKDGSQKIRRDFYYRIKGFPIRLPPLRERRERIPQMVRTIMGQLLARDPHLVGRTLSAGAMEALQRHDWPGNVRELRNVLARSMAFSFGPQIEAGDVLFDRIAFVPAATPDTHVTSPWDNWLTWVASRLSRLSLTFLVSGETGTGKNHAVERIHKLGGRHGPLIVGNLAGVPEGLAESELFGHVKDAFTDAASDRRGLFEAADGGTLLIDEVGDLSLKMQAKLLRVLETGRYMPVGSNMEYSVDVRVVAATNKDLAEEVRAGRFRADLYYRLNVMEVVLPPLRQLPEEIPLLASQILKRFGHHRGLSREALTALQAYSWPGNVRELESVLQNAAIRARDRMILAEHLDEDVLHPSSPQEEDPFENAPLNLEELEVWQIERVAGKEGDNKSHLAQTLRIERSTLDRKLEHYHIDIHRVPPPHDHLGIETESLEYAERDAIARALFTYRWNVSQAARALGVVRGTLKTKIEKYRLSRGPNDEVMVEDHSGKHPLKPRHAA